MVDYDLKSLLEKLREKRPLVHNITNYVVMNFTANTLLAMGASPVMAHAVEEVEEMVGDGLGLGVNVALGSNVGLAVADGSAVSVAVGGFSVAVGGIGVGLGCGGACAQ